MLCSARRGGCHNSPSRPSSGSDANDSTATTSRAVSFDDRRPCVQPASVSCSCACCPAGSGLFGRSQSLQRRQVLGVTTLASSATLGRAQGVDTCVFCLTQRETVQSGASCARVVSRRARRHVVLAKHALPAVVYLVVCRPRSCRRGFSSDTLRGGEPQMAARSLLSPRPAALRLTPPAPPPPRCALLLRRAAATAAVALRPLTLSAPHCSRRHARSSLASLASSRPGDSPPSAGACWPSWAVTLVCSERTISFS